MAYTIAICGSYLFTCGKTSNMQLSKNSLSLQAIWLEVNWSMTDPIYSVSRLLIFFCCCFWHTIYRIECLHLCYIHNATWVVLWQNKKCHMTQLSGFKSQASRTDVSLFRSDSLFFSTVWMKISSFCLFQLYFIPCVSDTLVGDFFFPHS